MIRIIILFIVLSIPSAWAHDHRLQTDLSPQMKKWFDGLKSGKGPCCSDSDGTALSDVDWQTNNGRYSVRINGLWIDVPDEAVLTGPNRAGVTMVWPLISFGIISIRCFIPGTMI
jgi:hypothetical protein